MLNETKILKQNGKDYFINLRAFNQTKIKLETELRNNFDAQELMETYCSSSIQFKHKNALLIDDGANPLLSILFNISSKTDKEEDKLIYKSGVYIYTKIGALLLSSHTDEEDESSLIDESRQKDYTDKFIIPTPDEILLQPMHTWREFQRNYKYHQPLAIISKAKFNNLKNNMRQWLRANHFIWSTIVGRLKPEDVHISGELEMSNGVHLYSELINKHSHAHAESLGTMLRILVNIRLLNPDPQTNKLESITNYFSRCKRISREINKFPDMEGNIPATLLKLFILQGLSRSDSRYESQITNMYTRNLKDELDDMESTMRTIEGSRRSEIESEYAPMSSEASVAKFTSKKPQNDKSDGKNYSDEDSKRKRRKGFTYNGQKGLCRHYVRNGTCRFGSRCRYLHSKKQAAAFMLEREDDARYNPEPINMNQLKLNRENILNENDLNRSELEEDFP